MRSVRPEITCIHCWARFPSERIFWVSEHRDLFGDPQLADAQLRFLPNRFDVQGNAIDGRGLVCRDLACPHCHLTLPKAILSREPFSVSILGTPSCGKSFYLAALATHLRRELPLHFAFNFNDADPAANLPLSLSEEKLFVNSNSDQLIRLGDLIEKTQMHSDRYYKVNYGDTEVTYPRAFSFLMEPSDDHPNARLRSTLERLVVFYDNAGEHFLPGQDSANAPGTRHLVESQFLLFLFDPTQDPRWHQALKRESPGVTIPMTRNAGRQEAVLREAAVRIRKLLKLPDNERHKRPLIVVLNKADVWLPKTTRRTLHPVVGRSNMGVWALDVAALTQQSEMMRSIVQTHVPELCIAAESFADTVYYVPVSALGTMPEFDESGAASIRPSDIQPWNVVIPFLTGLISTTTGFVARSKARTEHSTNGDGQAHRTRRNDKAS